MIPVSVISGYLGAGKTTLINEILTSDHGIIITLLVNDFGEVNIDASLIESSTGDMIALTNGCACCTINNDLTGALEAIQRRSPLPDAVVIEGSGVANLGRLAAVPDNYPGYYFALGLTLIDLKVIEHLVNDKFVGSTVTEQITAANHVILTKTETMAAALILEKSDRLQDRLGEIPTIISRHFLMENLRLLLTTADSLNPSVAADHPDYQHAWLPLAEVSINQLKNLISTPVIGLLRMKGFVEEYGQSYLMQIDTSSSEMAETRPGKKKPQGVQIIGAPDLDMDALVAKLSACQISHRENSSQFLHEEQLHAP